MTKTVIMWSGGADSTLIVDEMLRNTTDELILHHIVFKSDVVEDSKKLYIQRHNLTASAQLVALKQIDDYWKQEGYRPFTLDIIYYQHSFQGGGHGIAAPIFGIRAIRKYNADRFITGHRNAGDGRYGYQKYPTKEHKILFELEMQYDATGNSKPSNVKWERPLSHLNRGNKMMIAEQLPPALRELVVTCDYPTTYGDHWVRCYECIRCKDWPSYYI